MSDQTKQLYFLCGILVGAVAAFAVERTIPIRVQIDPITVKPAVVEVKQKMATTNIGPCACCGGGGGVTIPCCGTTIPSTLTATIVTSRDDGGEPCADAQFSLDITHNGSAWVGTYDLCGRTFTFTLTPCTEAGGSWEWQTTWGSDSTCVRLNSSLVLLPDDSGYPSCDPFYSVSAQALGGPDEGCPCCTGQITAITVTITE